MEPKLIFWIIGLILYFWIRSKKNSIPGNTGSETSGPPASSPTKPMTFEDLLREIERGKSPNPPTPTQPEVFSEEFEEENYEEEVPVKKEEPKRVFKPEILESTQSFESNPYPQLSLEETLKLQPVDTNAPKFKEYIQIEENPLARQIAADFSDPNQLKKAFIMGEVLNRKWSITNPNLHS